MCLQGLQIQAGETTLAHDLTFSVASEIPASSVQESKDAQTAEDIRLM